MTRLLAAVASLILGCAGPATPPSDAAIPDDPSAECVLGAVDSSADGGCVARWSCRSDGLHTLSCGGVQGEGCVCIVQGMAPSAIPATPPGCVNAEQLTTFARTQCGWTGL